MKICGTCKFWEIKKENKDIRLGRCHQHPAVIYISLADKPLYTWAYDSCTYHKEK